MGHGVIVGIAGPAGSGKDTVALYVRNQLFPDPRLLKGNQWIALRSLAEPMKRFCMDIFGWDHDQLFGPSAGRSTPDPDGVTPRSALQTLGTEWGRVLREDVWVDYLLKSRQANEITIVTDVRFPNEARKIREVGGIIVHVRGRNEDGDKSHASETHVGTGSLMVEGDVVVFNTGTLEDLECGVKLDVMPRIWAKLEEETPCDK